MWCICSVIVGAFCLKTSPLCLTAVSSLLFVAVSPLCWSSAFSWDACRVEDDGSVGVVCWVSSSSTFIGWVGCEMVGDVVGSCLDLSAWYVLPALPRFCLNSMSDICLISSLPCSSLNCSIASALAEAKTDGLFCYSAGGLQVIVIWLLVEMALNFLDWEQLIQQQVVPPRILYLAMLVFLQVGYLVMLLLIEVLTLTF